MESRQVWAATGRTRSLHFFTWSPAKAPEVGLQCPIVGRKLCLLRRKPFPYMPWPLDFYELCLTCSVTVGGSEFNSDYSAQKYRLHLHNQGHELLGRVEDDPLCRAYRRGYSQ